MRIAFIPIVLICWGLAISSVISPFHVNFHGFYGQDPSYQYLFSALDILSGNSPVHTDHPGTPVQTAIAIITAVSWAIQFVLGFADSNLFDAVLRDPERYLRIVSISFVLLNGFSALFLGRRVFVATNKIWLTVLCQLNVLFFPAVSGTIAYPSPESMLWVFSTILTGLLVSELVLSGEKKVAGKSKLNYVIPALICGMGVAIKVTFAPLVLLMGCFVKKKNLISAAASVLIGLAIGLSPAYDRIPKFASFLLQVATHSGLHGGGSKQFIDTTYLLQTFKVVVSMFWPLFMTLTLLWVVIVCKRPSQQLLKRAILISIVVVLQTIMVIKHWGPNYIIPILPVMSLLFVMIYICTGEKIKVNLCSKLISNSIVAVSFVYAMFISGSVYVRAATTHTEAVAFSKQTMDVVARYQNPLMIGAFNCNLELCATWLGLLHTPHLQLQMSRVNADFAYFNIFNKRMHFPGLGEVDDKFAKQLIDKAILDARKVLLVSPDYPQLAYFDLDVLAANRVQGIYVVKGLAKVRD